MNRTARRAGSLLLLAAAATLPGCFFVRSAVPLDTKGMELPLQWTSSTFADQCRRTGATVENLPADFNAHLESCRRNLLTYPGE